MKCGLNNFWWQFPKTLRCEGSIISQEEIEKMKSKRNGHGFWKLCDGDIEIDVNAIDAPYYGGSDAELKIEFRCNSCGNSYYPDRNLPNKYNINEWLNNILKGMK